MTAQSYASISVKKNVLLLQGPVGGFFNQLAEFFNQNGVKTYKIHFHLGGQVFYKQPRATLYRDTVEGFPAFIQAYYQTQQIEQIFLLGAHKIYHQIAIEQAKKFGIEVFVFEEGYIRPDFVTLEKNGVNGDSSLPKTARTYKDWGDSRFKMPEAIRTLPRWWRPLRHLCSYYKYGYAGVLSQWGTPHYQHHLPYRGWKNFWLWNRLGLQLLFMTYLFPYKKFLANRWVKAHHGQFYLVALQINTDTQITKDSPYESVAAFIQQVIKSFTENAPRDKSLLIKHHPYDRAHHNYKPLIHQMALQHKVLHRVKYVIDAHLPTCFSNALGCVSINSTLGFTALAYKVPTIVMSKKAIYNIPGLTYQNGLDQFWQDFQIPDAELFEKFRNYVVYHSQIRGSFYDGIKNDFAEKFVF